MGSTTTIATSSALTLHHPFFWLYLLTILVVGLGLVSFILVTQYHAGIDLRNDFIVLDTDAVSFSVQWPKGQLGVWMWSGGPGNRKEWKWP